MSDLVELAHAADCWRGSCLNYFARTEAAVAKTLEAAQTSGKLRNIRHLAGQRLSDLIALSGEIDATDKQKSALSKALKSWQSLEQNRQYLAHGVATIAVDQKGAWIAIYDLKTYRSNVGKEERWAVKQSEAEEFSSQLGQAFKLLSGQLGQFRKRIEAA